MAHIGNLGGYIHTFLDMPFCHKIHEAMDKYRIKYTEQLMLQVTN